VDRDFQVQQITKCTDYHSCSQASFIQFGMPNKMRSDDGTQITAEVTKKFMQHWGINHNMFNAPHFPSSNGLAESAFKSTKALVSASASNGGMEHDTFAQRNYTVKIPSGRILWRNRRHIHLGGGRRTIHPHSNTT